MGQGKKAGARRGFAAQLEWQPVLDLFAETPEKDLLPKIADYLWTAPTQRLPLEVLQQHTDRSSRDALVKTAMIQLMATPEYQLC